MREHIKLYAEKLKTALDLSAMQQVPALGEALREAWTKGNAICSNWT